MRYTIDQESVTCYILLQITGPVTYIHFDISVKTYLLLAFVFCFRHELLISTVILKLFHNNKMPKDQAF